MAATTHETRASAIEAVDPDVRFIASIRMAKGFAACGFQSRMEAQRWVSFQSGWFHPGSERIEPK